MNIDELKKTILIVEDEAVISIVIAKMLKKFGYNTLRAASGERAVELVIANEMIDLVLMDIDLGRGIDGTEAARLILAHRHIPIVFHTSHSEREMVEKVRGLTRYGYVVKSSGDFVLNSSIEMAFELFEANESIKKREEHYRALFENTGTSLLTIDEDTTITLVNDEFARIAGYPRSEIEGRKSWTEFVDKDDLEKMKAQHKLRRENPDAALNRYQFNFKTGYETLLTMYISITMLPGTNKSIASLIDISELKKAKNELKVKIEEVSAISEEFEAANEELITANRELVESESLYRTMFENTGTLMILIEDDMTISMANGEFIRYTGYSRDEIIGRMKWTDLVHPDDLAQMVKRHHDRRGSHNEILNSYEFRYITKSGEVRDVLLKIQLVPGTKKSIASLIDITERKKIEEEMNRSESYYRLVVENINDIIWTFDLPTMTYTFISPSAKRIFGYSADETVGFTMDRIFTPETRKRVMKFFGKYLEGPAVEKTLVLDAEHLRKDGSPLWMEISASPLIDENGKITGFLGITRNINERKQAERALQESEEKYRTILEDIEDGYYEVDLNGTFTFFNDSLCRIFGYSQNEMKGLNHRKCANEENSKKVFDAYNHIFKTGETISAFDYEIIRKDGTIRLLEVSASLIKNSSGEPSGFRGTTRDITERRQVEDELKSSLSMLNASLESTADGILVVDGNGHVVRWNQKFVDLWQVPEELQLTQVKDQVLNHVVSQMAKWDEFLDRVVELYAHPEESSLDILNLADGRVFERYSKPQKIGDEVVGRVWSFRDITSQRHSEDALVQKTIMQKMLMDMSSNYINIPIDQVGYTINESLKELGEFVSADRCYVFGYDFSEQIMSNRYEWCREGVESRIEEMQNAPIAMFPDWVETHSRGNIMYIEDASYLPEGELKDLLITQGIKSLLTIPMMMDSQCIGFIGFDSVKKLHKYPDVEIALLQLFAQMLVNVENRINTEMELNLTNRALEEATARAKAMAAEAMSATKAKSEFLATMSHEIRTPMNGVIGMTNLLLDTELTDEQRRFAELSKYSGNTLMAIINDILDFSKIEAGKLDLEIVDFNVRSLIEDLAAVLVNQTSEKGLELICTVDPLIPVYLKGDPGRLRQILLNLTGNAMKFTESGEIEISCVVKETREKSCVMYFSITDTGIGIPPDKQGLLFQKFSQADSSTTRRFGGTGLGLSISKQLSEMMGGEIGVISPASFNENGEGRGSKFWFTAELEKSDKKPESIKTGDLSGVKVLVVDGNLISREGLGAMLSSWKTEYLLTDSADAGLQALNEAQRGGVPFTIAILDMMMVGMDGAELGRKIKSDVNLKETHCVLLATGGKRGDAKKMKEIGFAAYLTKPVLKSDMYHSLVHIMHITEGEDKNKDEIITRHTVSENVGPKARLLLVEDNIVNQKVAQAILLKSGYSVDVVANGVEALKALEIITYNLIFMDCQMPIMDGFEATRCIRNLASDKRDVPIIAMTAGAMQGDREKCIEAGMNDYLSKPIEKVSIDKMLKIYL